MQNQMNYAESDSDTSAVEDYPLALTSEHVTSKSDQRMGRPTPKKRPLTKKDIKSSVKKMKTKNSDSSSEVPCTVADVSKSTRHSSFATLPLRESAQKSSANVNKTLNTSVKRHKESTPENEILYDKSAKQSLIEPVQSPVTTVVK
ncbi:hypothetical protein TNIN_164011 [Trichonephila inaurata madagascariensis]|uniref:Uncharacterized protein n=1 Tax=Trichonephila inaurata madagascariensis TaxID=2747483 RepID=A0A8X6YJ97_9ARAC|nr:hypothetical protein TNIN_164011 [Trichonephila inaurata madagascariensis]